LNIPADGVLTAMPASFFRAMSSDGLRLPATGSDEGRLGFWIFMNVGVFRLGMYGVVGVVMSYSCPESLQKGGKVYKSPNSPSLHSSTYMSHFFFLGGSSSS
jgi:hypothetical protein